MPAGEGLGEEGMCAEKGGGAPGGVASEGVAYTRRGVQRLAYFRRENGPVGPQKGEGELCLEEPWPWALANDIPFR